VTSAPKPVYLVKGGDPGLAGRALRELLDRLASGTSANVEEHWPEAGGSGDSDGEESEGGGTGRGRAGAGRFDLGPVLDACETPAFLFDRRVVVLRRAGALDAAQAKRLAAYIADPLPSTTLVLVAEDKAVPAALDKAVKSAGEVIDVTPPSNAGGRKAFVEAELRRAGVTLEREARALLDSTLGEDVAGLPNLVSNLAQAYGAGGHTVAATELAPFLGESGSVAPWTLTDAIDAGDIASAIDALHRMSGAGERHALAIVP
jgi:DNA polymerase-3 subunit delta